MKKMKAMIEKFGVQFLSGPLFRKLRVFNLILLIVATMIIFLMIEGYLGIRNIDTMQQANQDMLNTSIQTLEEINSLRNYLISLKEYLVSAKEMLAKSSSSNAVLSDTFINIESTLQSLQGRVAGDEKSKERLIKINDALQAVKQATAKAYSDAAAQKCESLLAGADTDLGEIKMLAMQNSYHISDFLQANSQKQKNVTIILAIISTVIAVAIGVLINASISWPLKEIGKAAKSIAAGDLTGEIRMFGCRETHEVTRELNNSLSSLRSLIGNVEEESKQVAQASDELKISAQGSSKSAQEAAYAMQELAQAATSQATQITETAHTVTVLGEMVRRVSKETAHISSISEKVAGSAQNGEQVTSDVAGEINQIYLSSEEIGAVIRDLNDAAKEIGVITAEIREIADQTTLLSLNASIEAARAGELGRGFGVVANETGNLAERCKKAAQEISDYTQQMFGRVEKAVQLMEQNMARVQEGQGLAGKATVTFKGIFDELKAVLTGINEVATSVREMSGYNEKVINAVTNISAISEESMASTQEVAAAAQEQSAATQLVKSQAEHLGEISGKMKEIAAQFTI